MNNVYRSSKGILWLATGNGISRYDGFDFTNFGPQDGIQLKHIHHIYESSDGTIWFAVIGGVIKYQDHQFVQYTEMGDVTSPIVVGTAETVDNRILFWIPTGIILYQDGRFSPQMEMHQSVQSYWSEPFKFTGHKGVLRSRMWSWRSTQNLVGGTLRSDCLAVAIGFRRTIYA